MKRTSNYSNRSIDINLLNSIVNPSGVVEVSLDIGVANTKIVTGIQKLIQKYTLIFLSIKDTEFHPNYGTDFIADMLGGTLQQPGGIPISFAFANADVLNILAKDVTDDTPDDEKIDEVILEDYNIDYNKGILYLSIKIITKAGKNAIFVLPTNSVIK